jgi:DNA invertase Pin-like site-specific DNA recombinase
MKVGYSRVSTGSQSLAAQEDALKAAGCERVYSEKISGVITDRRALTRAIAACGPGDVLAVTKLDRLARSLKDLLVTLDTVTKAGAGFKVLDNPALDTTTPYGALLLNVVGAIAQFERELIKSRTGDGRKRAMANGVRFGRKPKLSPFQAAEALRRREAGESLTDIGRSYGVAHTTISRLRARAPTPYFIAA